MDFVQIGYDIEAIVFTMAGKSVLWTDYGEPVVLEAKCGRRLAAENLMGEAVAISNFGGKVRFACDVGHPVFFNGVVRDPVFVHSFAPVEKVLTY